MSNNVTSLLHIFSFVHASRHHEHLAGVGFAYANLPEVPKHKPQNILARALPHQILAYVADRRLSKSGAADTVGNLRLADLHARLRASVVGTSSDVTPSGPADMVADCFALVEDRLGNTVREAIVEHRSKSDRLLARYGVLLDRAVRDVSLDECVEASDGDAQDWVQAVDDAILVSCALNNDDEPSARRALNALAARYIEPVKNYCRFKINSKDDANDVGQNAWIRIQSSLHQFDPALASFQRLALRQADYAVKDYYRLRGGTDSDAWDRGGSSPRFMDERCLKAVLGEVFKTTRPPHQPIAYGYCRLLQYKPTEVVDSYADEKLDALSERFSREFRRIFNLEGETFDEVFDGFRRSMDQPLSEITKAPKTRAAYVNLLDRIVGSTVLREYFVGTTLREHSADVVRWWSSVDRHVIATLAKNPDLADCLSD